MKAGSEHDRERELLLCCARTEAPEQLAARIRALAASDELDWDYLFQLARRHALIPLLYSQLAREGANFILPSDLAKLKLQHQQNHARNIILADELVRLISLFNDAGIEAFAYKGPALAVFAYGNLALRRFVDLDVVVRKQDVQHARDLLFADGYALSKALTPAQQELLLRTQHNLQFTRDNRRLLLELHWEVAPHLFASSVQEHELWQNLTSININNTELKTLAADDLLFSLCVHGSRHLWERLGWICDLAELIARHNLNWSALLKRAAETDSERMFLLGLYLAHKLLGTSLPPEVQARCDSDTRLQSLADNVIEHLFSGPTHVPATSSEIFKYNIGVRKSLAARARYFAHMLRPTDSDVGSRSLPPGFGFAYYLMRPIRFLFKTKTI
jgi:putative nucleotidyltransferase-like protein